MKRIAIVGSGIGGLHLGLYLRAHGIPATIYSDKTPAQFLAARISNVVVRTGPTRERERQLGVARWDGRAVELTRLSITVAGPRPLSFAGTLAPPAQVVDMRIYWPTLLEEFVARGGETVYGVVEPRELERLAGEYSLVVVACGRGSLCNLFDRIAEHSPHTEPQRLVVAALFRGIAYPDPPGFDVSVSRGNGEILSFPMFTFEDGVTGLGIETVRGGAFSDLRRIRYDTDPDGFVAAVLAALRDHAPGLHARVNPSAFALARPMDVGYAAITPTVRRGYAVLPNGRPVMALGDAHVVMDPITGQGANKASHAAFVLGAAIRDGDAFDDAFCRRVEEQTCAYVLPVSEACNARLQPPPPHAARLLGAAARHQAIADLYAYGFHHPDRYWEILSSPERVEALLAEFDRIGPAALQPYMAPGTAASGAADTLAMH